MCSSVRRNPLKINLHVWFYFIVFLTILYNTCETGHIESSIFLSLSASCFNFKTSIVVFPHKGFCLLVVLTILTFIFEIISYNHVCRLEQQTLVLLSTPAKCAEMHIG